MRCNPFQHLFPTDASCESPEDFPGPSLGRDVEVPPHTGRAVPDTTMQQLPLSPATSPATETVSQRELVSSERPGPFPPWPEGEEAEILLEEYRTHMSHLFPFVVVPPSISSYVLRHQRPFLWKSVMMASCHLDGHRQIILGNQILKDICDATMLKPQKTLDLLQGIEILISWFRYGLNSFQLTNLLFLARSICVSLGLGESQASAKQQVHMSQSLERMRAYAGCYYLVTL
jgi:hypothetical protein